MSITPIEAPSRVAEILDITRRISQLSKLGGYDCNVIGMAGEIIAEEVFGMEKMPSGTRHIDGHWGTGASRRSVQVKAWSENRVRKYRERTFFRIKEQHAADDLLVLLIRPSSARFEVLYKDSTRSIGHLENQGRTRRFCIRDFRDGDPLKQLLESLDAEAARAAGAPAAI